MDRRGRSTDPDEVRQLAVELLKCASRMSDEGLGPGCGKA